MMNKNLQHLQNEVQELEKHIQYYQRLFEEDGHLDTKEQQQLNQMQQNIDRVKQRLEELEKQPDHNELTDASVEELEDKVEGLAPMVEELGEGCTLTIAHYGNLTNSQYFFPTLFGISDTKQNQLTVPTNSEGTIFITSIWQYTQDRFKINPNKVVEPAKARRVYELKYDYTVSKAGVIDLKTSTSTETIHEWDMLTTLFVVESVTTQASGSTLTIQGGTITSQPFLERFQKQIIQQMRQGLKSRSWTVGLELTVEQPKKPASSGTTTQELVFEKENQAVLSSSELRVLHRWWKELKPDLRQQIRTQQAQIDVTGYTSKTGSDHHNYLLGKDRAEYVSKMLDVIIGKDNKGNPLAYITTNSEGEYKEDTNRCVKIVVRKKEKL